MLTVLRRAGVTPLLFTSFLARLPVAMSSLALVRFVVDQTDDFSYAALLTAVFVGASTIGQPLLGRIIDRRGHRRMIIAVTATISSAGFFATSLLYPASPLLTLVAALLAGVCTAPIESVLRSLWPVLFDERATLTSAYSLDAAVQEVAFILGPLLTAIGIALLGPAGVLASMAVVGLAGAVGFLTRPAIRHQDRMRALTPPNRHGSPFTSARFRRLTAVTVTAAVPIGVLTISATAYAQHHGVEALSAWAIALNALGALAGALLVARFPPRASADRLIRPGALMLALLYLPTAIASLPSWAWLVAAALSGVALPPLLAQIFAHTPHTVPPHQATEANAWIVSAFGIGIATGTLAAGQIVQMAGLDQGVLIAVVSASGLTAVGAVQASSARLDGAHGDLVS